MRFNYDKDEYVKEREKNAIFIGFSEEDKKRNSFVSGKDYLIDEREAIFPKIFYYDSEDNVNRMHGYCVYIKVNYDIKYVKENFILLDKIYRKKYRYFKSIVLYSEKFPEEAYFNFGKFSNLEIIDKYILYDYNYFDSIFEEYRNYCIKYKKKKYSKPKLIKIDNVRKILKDKKQISTNEIVALTGLNERSIQRYMHDINYLYNEIGYNESTNLWYIV